MRRGSGDENDHGWYVFRDVRTKFRMVSQTGSGMGASGPIPRASRTKDGCSARAMRALVVSRLAMAAASGCDALVSKKDASEKRRILADEYGMKMTAELERRIQIMCNWSESIIERERIRERIDAIGRMIRANITREQILSMGYTEAEYEKAESALYAHA